MNNLKKARHCVGDLVLARKDGTDKFVAGIIIKIVDNKYMIDWSDGFPTDKIYELGQVNSWKRLLREQLNNSDR